MLAVTARPDELLPPATQASALVLHLTHLRESPPYFPGAAVARSVHVDAAECHRRFLPIQLESVSWQLEPPKVHCPGEGAECLTRHPQQGDRRRGGGAAKEGLPLGYREPPWSIVNGIVGELMRFASRDVVGRIEQAANELGSFFCSRLPLIHFMDAASAPELAEFTLGLTSRLQLLRKEVNAAVLSSGMAEGYGWRRPPNASGSEALLKHQQQQQKRGHAGTPKQRRKADQRGKNAPRNGISGTPGGETSADTKNESASRRYTYSPSAAEPTSRWPAAARRKMPVAGRFFPVRTRHRRGSYAIGREGALGSRGALEVVDVQLQMQHQLLEISAGLAADIAEHVEKGAPSPSPEKLLQVLPELQRQLDLEKDWTQNMAQHAAKATDDDSPLGYYQRQVGRRHAVGEVLRYKDKETAELAFSLMNAAEWLHALKEEGRTPRAVFASPYHGGSLRAASVAAAPALLHWYRPSASWVNPPRLVDYAAEEEDIEETLQDARDCAPQGSSTYLDVPRSVQTAAAGGLPPAGTNAVVPAAHEMNNNSSSKQQRSPNRKKPDAGEDNVSSRGFSDKTSHWWEAEAASLTKDPKQMRRASLALVPHLHLALQTGPDWDCLGGNSAEANALWLFVMGRICTNSFFCEGLRSVLFGETLLIHDMQTVAKRAASGIGKPLSLTRVDAVLDGRQEGFARSELRTYAGFRG